MFFSRTTLFVIMLTLIIALLSSFLAVSADNTDCSQTFNQIIHKFKDYNSTNGNCQKLRTLGFDFAWQINEKKENEIHIVFGARLYHGMWLAWGVNPGEKPMMVGTRAIIGVKQPGEIFKVETYNVTAGNKLGCELQPSNIEPEVIHREHEYVNEHGKDYLAIHVKLLLPPEYNITKLNHVWQLGHGATGMVLHMHADNLPNFDSTETINLRTGERSGHIRGHRILIILHGLLNIIGWGILLPTGVIIARYFKYPLVKFKDWMYCLHVSCQTAGYSLGTAGWIIGMCLGKISKGYYFPVHRLYAIFIFTFTTVQMLAIRLRPKKTDEYRKYWNMYHHFLGFSLLSVIVINIFIGISNLEPVHKTWKWFYIGVLLFFAAVVLALETYTWTRFLSEKKQTASKTNSSPQTTDGSSSVQPVAGPQPPETN